MAESVIKGENLQEFFNDSSVPVVVAGDGNCLFNAISMYFTGSYGITYILRLLTCIELFCFCDHYAGALDVIWD